jgi:hypothetical protein
MIPFDAKMLTIEFVQLKTVTTALGGAITCVDDQRSRPNKEVYRRISVPFATARRFQQQHKTSKYLRPVWTAVIRYGDLVIALERHPLGAMGEIEEERFDGKVRRWEPFCERSIHQVIVPKTKAHDDWWFDGRYMYRFSRGIEHAVEHGRWLSKDGQFRAVECIAVDFNDLELQSKVSLEEKRTCVVFIATTGDFALTPPVWKTFDIVERTSDVKTKVTTQRFDFDEFDDKMALNISFAIKAGQELTDVFGHSIVEPLELPDLMVRMRTVNLPAIDGNIKATTPIHLSFKHAIAWLIGLLAQCETLDGYLTLRNLLKYLISKGVMRKDIFESSRLFRDDFDGQIPLLSREQAAVNAEQAIKDPSDLTVFSRANKVRQASVRGTAIGAMYDNGFEDWRNA